RSKGVAIGKIEEGHSSASYKGRSFRLFQAGTATVRGVVGECYWKVAIGEQAYTRDYINPPGLLSCEDSTVGSPVEPNWTLGAYLTPAEVQQAFNLDEPLPRPIGVAPNQVFPYKRIYPYAFFFFMALCFLGVVMLIISPKKKLYEQTFQLRSLA